MSFLRASIPPSLSPLSLALLLSALLPCLLPSLPHHRSLLSWWRVNKAISSSHQSLHPSFLLFSAWINIRMAPLPFFFFFKPGHLCCFLGLPHPLLLSPPSHLLAPSLVCRRNNNIPSCASHFLPLRHCARSPFLFLCFLLRPAAKEVLNI